MATNKSVIVSVIIFLLISGGVLILLPSNIRGAPGTIYVNDNASCPCWYDAIHVRTIQEGIDTATSGDTVFVYKGTYNERVMVNKTINLVGEDKNKTIISGINNGIWVNADYVTINNFLITNTRMGLCINSNYNLISNNIIENQPAHTYAILCYSDFNIITDNIISYVFNGTALWGGDNNTIIQNWYVNNSHFGVGAPSNAENNVIYHNNFVNSYCYDENSNTWHNGYPSGGNYWSDFDEPSEGAYDNDSDGIVDSPYTINSGGNQDLYPLMEPYSGEDWNPWDDDGVVTLSELQEVVYYWIQETPVNGHIVVVSDLQEMVFLWLNP